MKVAIDTLPLLSGHKVRGMGMYARNLIKSLEREASTQTDITIDSFDFSENPDRLKNYDLLHYPYFDLFTASLPIKSPVPFVVTVPDLIPLLYPQYYPPGAKGSLKYKYQRFAVKRAVGIITISETSKKDIVRLLKIANEKIFTTYLAPNFRVKKSTKREKLSTQKKYSLPSKFVLYVGDVNWNKNVIRLIEATLLANVKLVIVGKQAVSVNFDKNHIENVPLYEIFSKYANNSNILRLGYVDDHDLNAIWQLATMYCQPSLYEGFGLPVLEAFDAKIPVLASKTQALVEVGGNACVYFDPYNVSELSEKIGKLMSSKLLRDKYVLRGTKRLQEFTWDRTARETIAAYRASLEV